MLFILLYEPDEFRWVATDGSIEIISRQLICALDKEKGVTFRLYFRSHLPEAGQTCLSVSGWRLNKCKRLRLFAHHCILSASQYFFTITQSLQLTARHSPHCLFCTNQYHPSQPKQVILQRFISDIAFEQTNSVSMFQFLLQVQIQIHSGPRAQTFSMQTVFEKKKKEKDYVVCLALHERGRRCGWVSWTEGCSVLPFLAWFLFSIRQSYSPRATF